VAAARVHVQRVGGILTQKGMSVSKGFQLPAQTNRILS
jgi:hypothetical protein